MKPNFRKVLEMAVEDGVRYGYSRAHKHVDKPSEGAIIDNVTEGVMHYLYEWFEFEDEYKDD